MKISILGWYGKGNVGDEAFRSVFNEIFVNHTIEFVTPPKLCNDPDILILGGGAVVSPFYLGSLPNCPRYALGVDISYLSEIDLLASSGFSGVYVRNSTDLETLREKLSCPVAPMPDLAFYLKPVERDILKSYKLHPDRKTVGVFVTDYVNPAIDRPINKFAERSWSFKVNLAKQLDQLHRDGYEVMLVPCSTAAYGNDRRINLDLAAFMTTEPTIVMDALSPREMIALIRDLNVALCMRFHAHIFSFMMGTPFLSIEFTRKVRLFLEEHDLRSTMSCHFDGSEFVARDLSTKVEDAQRVFDGPKCLRTSKTYRERLDTILRQVSRDWLKESL